jgi:peptidoglycan lytic transglycosylase A
MKYLRRAVGVTLVAATVLLAGVVQASGPRHIALRFDELLGWDADDQTDALRAFTKSCADISAKEWHPLCKLAETKPDAKWFFETFFTPVVVRPKSKALFTGYYEPELDGSLYKVGKYQYPIYQVPKNLIPKDENLTREAIDKGALKNKGLEIAYVDDPVEAYYLHIQGSGRIKLTNGNTIRVGYAGENGHVYRSAAGELVRLGEIPASQASIGGIRNWVRKNPEKGRKALQFNASYVFFRRLETIEPNVEVNSGPMGALDRPITTLRSIAVDPKFIQMGAPVWIEKGGRNVMRRLMVAQDVGSAIKGPQRADIFFGTGITAGQRAGETRDSGRMVVLLPIQIALRLAPEG